MKLDRALVAERIRETKQPTYQADDLIATLDLLVSRLSPTDHHMHHRRADEARRFLRLHYGIGSQIDTTLIDFAAMCFYAGICEADGEPYDPPSARAAAVVMQVKARLTRTATPEADQSLAAPQTNGENGVTQV